MRRADREIRDRAAIRALMEEALVCRIGLVDGLAPYVVPMNFGLGEDCLYLHCATEGRKLEILRKNDRVCFEMDLLREVKQGPEACGWSARYESVIGFGRAVLLTDLEEKRRGLDRIMDHYGATGPYSYPDDRLAKTAVIRIDIERLTGKRRE
ncbi:MAG: pyridoxamine 5'-phosphate oxidase family protein [Proteobacteria bacterium]|nr:pyridoxamine 5'-phosphate oxidase family protein [Pseudomonadota bacterium]MBU2260849.1 pyridoxamine 5'-phosphate oxidase family protein [Pseudomonadota bacterium]